MRILIIGAAFALPTFATAERMVTNTAFCDSDIIEIVDAGEMVLTATGLEGAEYYCEWDAAIALTYGADLQEIRSGYCGSSDMIFPKTFAFFADQRMAGHIRYYESDGDGTATLFYTCE